MSGTRRLMNRIDPAAASQCSANVREEARLHNSDLLLDDPQQTRDCKGRGKVP